MDADSNRASPDAGILERVSGVNVGLPLFADALAAQGAPVAEVDWRPPAGGERELVRALLKLYLDRRVASANGEVVRRIEAAAPRVVGIEPAREALGLEDRVVLHSGPPIDFARMCDPQRRAIIGACRFEGWASQPAQAERLLERGEVALRPCNEHWTVAPMAGVVSPSTAVWVVEDEESGARACAPLSEGPGATFWLGSGGEEPVRHARFLGDAVAPALGRALRRSGPIDVFDLVAQGLQMGDECHMRSQATGNLLLRALLPALIEEADADVARFLSGNNHFFLTLTMAAARACSRAAEGVEGSSVVTLMARNGVDFGIQIAALPGRWFLAEAPAVGDPLFYEGYDETDAAPDIGDSAVIEAVGLGGMATAAAPAVSAFLGGTVAEAVERTRLMGEIAVARSARFRIPSLGFEGTPVGVDVRLVVDLGVTPQLNTGILHARSGAGQIGAGVATAPLAPFAEAVRCLAGNDA
jgi:Protein of unknown function (DUF1116)